MHHLGLQEGVIGDGVAGPKCDKPDHHGSQKSGKPGEYDQPGHAGDRHTAAWLGL
jgi:hypothetical protein